MGYRLLPVSDLPTVDFPDDPGHAGSAGREPGTMAASVATPLEKEFSTIAGVDSMSVFEHRWAARRSRCSST